MARLLDNPPFLRVYLRELQSKLSPPPVDDDIESSTSDDDESDDGRLSTQEAREKLDKITAFFTSQYGPEQGRAYLEQVYQTGCIGIPPVTSPQPRRSKRLSSPPFREAKQPRTRRSCTPQL